jgi:putative ABC transport system substrate-binding protein
VRTVGLRTIVVKARNEIEIDSAFATIAQRQADAVLVNVDAYFSARREQLASLAARYRIPASYNNRIYVEAGGLMSYGDDRRDSYRHLGVYAGRILNGEKPADLCCSRQNSSSSSISRLRRRSASPYPTCCSRAPTK